MNPQTLTIRFEVYPMDISEQYYPPLPNPGIEDVAQASIENGLWTISATVGDHHFVGEPAEDKNEAILNFLKVRIGLGNQSSEQPGKD
jgi:hypothetical protein